jgi:plastocyanin
LRKLIATLVVVSLLGGLAVLGVSVATGSDVRAARTKTVKVGDDYFDPEVVRIYRRDIVRWVWVDPTTRQPGTTGNEHTVTEARNRFTSEEMTSGVYRRRFRSTGRFTIICAVHPSTMRMKVVVKRRPS